MRPVVDSQHRQYAETFSAFANMNGAASAAPTDPAGTFLIGHPDSMPAMRDLCRRAGFVVQGDTLTYDGTKIDLKDGAAIAIIDLGNGKTCAIGLGVTKRAPSVGKLPPGAGSPRGR